MDNKWVLLVLLFVLSMGTIRGEDHHVAINGTAGGDGTELNPWDLNTALSHPSKVKPGDNILIHEGVYSGYFEVNLEGQSGNPITVKPFKDDVVILECPYTLNSGNVLTVYGNYTTIQGLIITAQATNRDEKNGKVLDCGGIYVVTGQGHKILNKKVHGCDWCRMRFMEKCQ